MFNTLSKKLVLLLLAIQILSCVPENKYSFVKLSDCTDIKWEEGKEYWHDLAKGRDTKEWFKALNPVMSLDKRKTALEVASDWASNNGYLPCSFQLCGMVVETSSKDIMVYATSEKRSGLDPEVMIALDGKTHKILDSSRWHSGCVHRRQAENESNKNS